MYFSDASSEAGAWRAEERGPGPGPVRDTGDPGDNSAETARQSSLSKTRYRWTLDPGPPYHRQVTARGKTDF